MRPLRANSFGHGYMIPHCNFDAIDINFSFNKLPDFRLAQKCKIMHLVRETIYHSCSEDQSIDLDCASLP